MKPGSQLLLTIDRLSLGGDGVGRAGALVIFVPYACPGDTLEVEIIEARPRFARARPLRVVTPSPHRVAPPCPYHFRTNGESRELKRFCGGCSFQHIAYPAQLEIKRQSVQETLERIGGVRGVTVRPTLGMADPWRYRNKVQVPIGWNGKNVIAGFYAPSSHEIIPIDDCLVQPELSVRIVNRTRELLQKFGIRAYDERRHNGWIRHLLVRTAQGRALLVFVTRTEDFPHLGEILRILAGEFPELAGIHQNVNPARTNVILGRQWRRLAGADTIEEKLGRLRFQLSPASFFQINPVQTEVLYNVVKDLAAADHGTLLDLYCGVGAIALWLASSYRKVIGVDEVKSAVADASRNAALNQIRHAEFFADTTEAFFARRGRGLAGQRLTIILDPPRAGCTPAVLKGVAQLRPRNLVYVSCDVGTLARDLSILSKMGFRALDVQPVDLFPHTPHIETVVRLAAGH